MDFNRYKYSSMVVTDYNFTVPLDYGQKEERKISIFAREILNEKHEGKSLPYLIFFQGGPGYESPRPLTNSGWIQRASEDYKVLLIDQRGTGLSTPIDLNNMKNLSDQEVADYLTFFRADNIVRDAEHIKKHLIGENKWSVLGQSFGGFCAMNYVSFFPDSLEKVFITGGLPPLDAHPDDIYRKTFKKVIEKNKLFFQIFPKAKKVMNKIAKYLKEYKVALPNGDILSIKRFQQLGLNLGFSDGMASLNFLFESAFVNNHISYSFLKNIFTMQTFDTNPIFTILHEACYAQGFSTNWSAQRIIEEYPIFSDNIGNLYLTGEMLFPWMLDEYQSLKPFKNAANMLAKKSDWPQLYDANILSENKIPIKAAVYTHDMYVDRDFSVNLAKNVPNIEVWETDIYEHNALRSDGKKILDNLFNL